jgi:OPA family glycerol-3-phosphate transporter-like MFS transporter 3
MAPCNKEQLAVFLITFFAYAAIHAMRTSWSYSKKLLQGQHGELDISNVQLGVTDTVFLLCYSFGFAFIAPLGDRYNRRRFLVAGYLVCLAGYLFYPVAYHFFGLGNVLFLIVSMGVSGLGSSVGVPGSMGILDRWFHGGHKGLIIGLWTGCQCLGNIIGFISSTIITQYLHLRWEYNFFYNGLVTLFLTIVTLYFLREEPFETDADNMGRESVPSEE